MSDQKIIFSMVGVGKVYKPNHQVLKDIYLSFYYGAKIGVLGLNGAGKSTLLRIIAGLDQDYLGKIQAQKGITFGYLPQEPELDPEKTVRDIVEEGARETVELVLQRRGDTHVAADQVAVPADADTDAVHVGCAAHRHRATPADASCLTSTRYD